MPPLSEYEFCPEAKKTLGDFLSANNHNLNPLHPAGESHDQTYTEGTKMKPPGVFIPCGGFFYHLLRFFPDLLKTKERGDVR
jgi:hypothetical protein